MLCCEGYWVPAKVIVTVSCNIFGTYICYRYLHIYRFCIKVTLLMYLLQVGACCTAMYDERLLDRTTLTSCCAWCKALLPYEHLLLFSGYRAFSLLVYA